MLSNYFPDLGADWKMKLESDHKGTAGSRGLDYLAKQRNQLRAPVNTVINIRIS